MWRLAYAIRGSSILLPGIYPTADAPCLRRKLLIWQDYATRHGLRVTSTGISEPPCAYKIA